MLRGHRSIFLSLFEPESTPDQITSTRKGRSEDLIIKRNELLICRYYYLVKIVGLQYMSALERIESEFFLTERTIIDMLGKNSGILKTLTVKKPSLKYFRERYPFMVWN